MKPIFLLAACVVLHCYCFPQNKTIDSLRSAILRHPEKDTTRVNLLNSLAQNIDAAFGEGMLPVATDAAGLAQQLNFLPGQILAFKSLGSYYLNTGSYDSSLKYYNLTATLATRTGDSSNLAWATVFIGEAYHYQSNYPTALLNYLKAVSIFESLHKEKATADVLGTIGVLYQDMGEPKNAEKYFTQNLHVAESLDDSSGMARCLNNLGGIYHDQHQFEKAEEYFQRGLVIATAINDRHSMALLLRNLADIEKQLKRIPEAIQKGIRSFNLYTDINEPDGIADVCFILGDCYNVAGKPDSAIYFAKKSLDIVAKTGFTRNVYDTYRVLATAYAQKKNFAEAFAYEKRFAESRDSAQGTDLKSQIATIKYQSDLDKKQSEIELLKRAKLLKEQEARQQRIKAYSLAGILLLTAVVVILLIRNNRRNQKTNLLLQEQKEEIQYSLKQLKLTQAQLIQTEKLASLGQVTAGIAHEIQNPLNFVNNFSEINEELIGELKDLAPDNNAEDYKKLKADLLSDLAENSSKITLHGKRAEAIVKGMLEHSRSGTGEKQLTDVNALADEFLKITYHGARAKNGNLQVELTTDFDPAVGKIMLASQDIGRVLLNIYNNAFYAVNEKAERAGSLTGYKPALTVGTKKYADKIEITVGDNGVGIHQNMIDKIFQPFFTTKPTGAGTGLGLSLAYEIAKAHGGGISASSQEGRGTEFVISLPL